MTVEKRSSYFNPVPQSIEECIMGIINHLTDTLEVISSFSDVNFIASDIDDHRSCKNQLYPKSFTHSREIFSGDMASRLLDNFSTSADM